jgi:hypothetical protein
MPNVSLAPPPAHKTTQRTLIPYFSNNLFTLFRIGFANKNNVANVAAA